MEREGLIRDLAIGRIAGIKDGRVRQTMRSRVASQVFAEIDRRREEAEKNQH